jgi:RNA polymerase sigma-70 factor (ECF subfamily)
MRHDTSKAFENAYTSYNDELFRHCYLRISDRERAVELTQEAFLKTWDYIEKGNVVLEFRPFLYRTLKNLIIDEYRKMKSQSLEAMVEGTEGGSVEALLPPDESNTLEAAINRFEGTRALDALKLLPDSYKEVLIFRYVEGLSPKEIAAQLGENENAVSVRVHRGLKKLRDLLEEPETQIS